LLQRIEHQYGNMIECLSIDMKSKTVVWFFVLSDSLYASACRRVPLWSADRVIGKWPRLHL
jgi:hypothetical protein